MLMKRNYLFFMNFIHNINALKWKFFIVMIRDEYERYWLCDHMLSNNENDDIIVVFLKCLQKWYRIWHFRYAIIDDFAIEQKTMKFAFRNFRADEQKMFHFLCRTHSKRTFNRKLIENKCKQFKKHLYRALYFRKIRDDVENNVNETLTFVFDDVIHKYIKNNWYATLSMWVNYVRQHFCILLQCMTTNIVKFWHVSLKTHDDD